LADNLVGKGGTVSVQPLRTRHALAPRQTSGGALVFPGGGDGWVELISASGQAVARMAVTSGRAQIPARAAGIWALRWKVGGNADTGTLLLR
jgi:hypothetical protein